MTDRPAEEPGEITDPAGWLLLLRRLSVVVPRRGVWKNAEAGLEASGDVDFAAPEADWPAITEEFCAWAAGRRLHPVIACRHVPGTLVLVAVEVEKRRFLQLDIRARARMRGAEVFAADDLVRLMQLDRRGFWRLRPGAEGLLKLALVGVARGGGARRAVLARENVRALLLSDPEGAREAATLFGAMERSLHRAATSYAAGGWSRRRMLVLEAWALLQALRKPGSLRDRRRERAAKRECPILRTSILHSRRIPGDVGEWLNEAGSKH